MTIRKGVYLAMSLQTTGLEAESNSIVEAGFALLDGYFEPVAPSTVCLVKPKTDFEAGALKLHEKNGLVSELVTSAVFDIEVVDAALVQFVKEYGASRVVLCTNSPIWTLQYVERWLPQAAQLLRQDVFDLSSVRKLVLAAMNKSSESDLKRSLGYGVFRSGVDLELMLAEIKSYHEAFRRGL